MYHRNRRSRPHSSQSRRWLPSLAAETFPVDERGPIDLIAFATAFSTLLVYRGESDEIGNWDRFFIGDLDRIPGDISFLIAKIASVDAKREYLDVIGRQSKSTDDLLLSTYKALTRLDEWSQRLALARVGKPPASVEQRLSAMLDALIAGDYSFGTSNLPELVGYLGTDPTLKESWRRICNGKELRGEIWSQLPDTVDDAPRKHDPVEIYGLVNRTTRAIAEQAHGFLQASLQQSNHAPHAALLLTFITLYARVQDDLNRMTGRHLNFYFRTILQLAERGSRPDQAYLAFVLAPDAEPFTLPRGSQIDGGVDALGQPIVFALDEDVALDHARVERLASFVLDRATDGSIAAITARPVADSQDGFGAKLLDPARGWSPFGGTADDAGSATTHSVAEIGITIRSPCLLLRGGVRQVQVALQFEDASALQAGVARYLIAVRRQLSAVAAKVLSDTTLVSAAFCLTLECDSVEHPVAAEVDLSALDAGKLGFSFTLGRDAPALALAAGVMAISPALRIGFSAAGKARVFAYSFFAGLALVSVALDVTVTDLAPLTVQAATGPVDAAKPFAPFGPLAPQGAGVIFSHPDLSGKAIDRLTIDIQWSGLPIAPASLQTVYAPYAPSLTNDSFRASLFVLWNYDWELVAPGPAGGAATVTYPLFDWDSAGMVQSSTRTFQLTPRFVPLDHVPGPYGPASRAGFFRLQLTEPAIGFGHAIYPQLLTTTVMANAHLSAARQKPVPAAPVTPMIAALSLSYHAHADLIVDGHGAGKNPSRDEGVFRYGPFGMRTYTADRIAFPLFTESGYLMIGFSGADASRSATVLLHAGPDAADMAATVRDQTTATSDGEPTYRTFTDNAWTELPLRAITRDTTSGLCRSGLIGLQFPDNVKSFAAPGTSELIWLMIAVTEPDRYGKFVDLYCQGTTATRVSPLTPALGNPILPAGSLIGIVPPNPRVSRVIQPFATENGVSAEDERQFQIRVSERLRHKQRAIVPRDYEALILDRFPGIGDAKCLSREEARWFGATPGEVVIVVAPIRVGDTSVARPRVPLYLLRQIGAYLMELCPASVRRITVRNPDYEPLRVSAAIQFQPGDRAGYFNSVLQTVDNFIAPWRNDPTLPLAIGSGHMDLAALRQALEDLGCVDEVTGLSMVQFYQNPAPTLPSAPDIGVFERICDTARPNYLGQQLVPWWPWSVLVPAVDHQLRSFDASEGIGTLTVDADFIVTSAGGDLYRPQQRAGIGNLEVGVDLLVQAGIDHLTINEDFIVG